MEKLEYAVAPGWWHGLAPLNFGWEACAPGHQFGPAVRHYHLLHYVLEGEGTFLKGGATYRVDAGDLFVIRPEEVTTYRASTARPWQYVWLGFQAGETPPFLQAPVIRQPPVRKLFESLREQCRYEHQDGRVFALLYDVLWRLSQDAPPPASRQEPYAAYAKAYLETSYMQPVMDVLAGDIYQAQLVFTVGQTYDLTIQWTAADGAVANEKLGTVDFTATQTEPELAWGRTGGTLDYGYYINRSGNKKYLELSCYPVEVELTVPNWMKIADVTLELRTGEEGEPLATAHLAADGWYSSGEETMMHAVWNGTFYKDDGPNEWLYADGQPFYRAIVTDATGTTWTFEVPLQEK